MIVSTWNIGSLYENYELGIAELKNIVKFLKSDILCMQEFPENSDGLIELIFEIGGFKHYQFHPFCFSHICRGSRMGNIIFSKYALDNLGIFVLPNPGAELELWYQGRKEIMHDKEFMAAGFVTENQQYIIITGHGFPFHRYGLEKNTELFKRVFEPLDEWINNLQIKYSDCRILIGADFNSEDVSSYMPELRKHFYDVFYRNITRPSNKKTDAFFIPNSKQYVEKQIITTVLDHYVLRVSI